MKLTPADVRAAEQELCRRSLAHFSRRAWHILEPGTPLKWGWALDAICAHLEAVTDGRVTRLLMNVPPGTMKSLLTSVIWPAWEWGPRGMPQKRFLGTAHAQTLAVRDAMKCRRLIQSAWYQDRWPVALTTDQNAKTKFENDRTGFREAMAFASMTGARGDRVILDDPLSADDANSAAALESARLTFTEALPTRINNDRSAIIVIMQRLHELDTSGLILEMGLPYDHLCIPMRYEGPRPPTSIGWTDPRSEPGELMFPERFPEAQVGELERTLGSYAAAGQLQQRPSPRGGAMFKRAWFGVIPAAPSGTKWCRGWDLAATAKAGADWTAGALVGRTPDGRFVVADIQRAQATPAQVRDMIRNTAAHDRVERGPLRVDMPQDPGQAGKAQAQSLVSMLAGYDAHASPETGDKITRATPFAAQAEAGNVDLVAGAWNRAFLDELEGFPMGKHDDQVDAASRAFNAIADASHYSLGGFA